jgi:signal transduction histidine kinase
MAGMAADTDPQYGAANAEFRPPQWSITAGTPGSEAPGGDPDGGRSFLQEPPGAGPAAPGLLRTLLRANAWLAEDLSLAVVLRRLTSACQDVLGAQHAAVCLLGEGGVDAFVHTGMDATTVETLKADPRGQAVPSLLVADIQVGIDVLGFLYGQYPLQGRALDDERRAAARAMAAGAAVAIKNARLFDESRQRARWLQAAGELTHRLLSDSAGDPMQIITSEAATAAAASHAWLILPVDDEQLIVKSAYGPGAHECVGRTATVDDSLPGLSIKSGKPLIVRDPQRELARLITAEDLGPVLIAPVEAGEEVRGALVLARHLSEIPFNVTDLSMTSNFGSHAAVALALVEARSDQVALARLEDHDRIARDLHDHVIQEVFAVGIGLQSLATLSSYAGGHARIMGYVEALDRVIARIRSTIFQLQIGPDYGGLEARVFAVARDHTAQLGFAPLVDLLGHPETVPHRMVDDVVAVIREALSNTARHAHATHASVIVDVTDQTITVVMTDNGRGIGEPTRRSGLANMRHRAEQYGGFVDFTPPEGGGARICWCVPLPAEAPPSTG